MDGERSAFALPVAPRRRNDIGRRHCRPWRIILTVMPSRKGVDRNFGSLLTGKGRFGRTTKEGGRGGVSFRSEMPYSDGYGCERCVTEREAQAKGVLPRQNPMRGARARHFDSDRPRNEVTGGYQLPPRLPPEPSYHPVYDPPTVAGFCIP